jgi:GNAT superfamily N-acetyltransferase
MPQLTQELTIRDAVPADATSLALAWQHMDVGHAVSMPEVRASIGEVRNDPSRVLGVAVLGDLIIGQVAGRRDDSDHQTLETVYVDPAHRLHGVGRRLVETFLAWAARDGRPVEAVLPRDDEAARRLLERTEFIPVAGRPSDQDHVTMRYEF